MDTECSICLNNLDKDDKSIITVNCCNHQFHNKCYLEWIKQKNACPLCRANYGTCNVILPDTVITAQVIDYDEYTRIRRIRLIMFFISVMGFTGFYYYLKTNYY